MEDYATKLQAVLDLEKQREQLEKNSVANAQAAIAARAAAVRAKNAEAEANLVRRRDVDFERREKRREALLARRGHRYQRFARGVVRGIQAELFERQRNLELLQEELEQRARVLFEAGDRDAGNRLRDQARTAEKQAGELGALAGDQDRIRRQFAEQIRREASERVVARLYARRVRQAEVMRELGKDAATILTSGLAKAIEQGGKLKDIFKQIGIQLAKLALQKLVIDQATGLLGGLFRSGLKGTKASPAPATPAPAVPLRYAAAGGPVQAGRLYRVGERGEELFRPAMAGTIIPNFRLRSMGGGGNVFHF